MSFYLFSLFLTVFCSGELIWRERNRSVQELYDVLPIPEWVPFLGKLGALIYIQVILMIFILITGILIQIFHGYFNFEFDLYLKEIFIIRLPYYICIAIFALFVQVLVNKKFIGYIITLLFVDDFMPSIGLEHHLWRFGSTPGYSYSDMNGYGTYIKPLLFYDLYWLSFGLLLIVLSMLLWIRGKDTNIRNRINIAKLRMTAIKKKTVKMSVSFCFIAGGFILFNTNIINDYESSGYRDNKQAEYEKTYAKYRDVTQPHITDVKVNVDIFPLHRAVNVKGRMILENRSARPIQEIFIEIPAKMVVKQLRLTVPFSSTEPVNGFGVYIFTLDLPLKLNDKIELNFDLQRSVSGFKDRNQETRLVKNGTFLTQFDNMPAIGYDCYSMNELSNNSKRKKYGLPAKRRIPLLDDKKSLMNTPLGKTGTWINFDAVISTSEDQIALAPGELIKEWENGNRKYFHFRSNEKILNYYSFISANYSVKKDYWNDVAIEVYYHRNHDYNVDLMIDAAKKSLEYFTNNFSPYQFKTIKLVEFPRYSIFAEGFPNMIPISEGYGFISKYQEDRVKEVFRVIAHEVGHQWWGHQVIGANVEGMYLLSEIMAQYSALMVIKKEYDQEKINKYMKF